VKIEKGINLIPIISKCKYALELRRGKSSEDSAQRVGLGCVRGIKRRLDSAENRMETK